MDITPEELKKRLDAGEKLNFFDVREEWEYDESNLGAINIPLATLPSRIADIDHLKGEEIIVHCRSGARSHNAQLYLQSQGFTNVKNLKGGILACGWA